ncbi:hypothetical protein [Peterkaempfera sp. SMS 1(5)a]|uniref:hypothetical protein n=1 Tax=Peterkaempfera podocarpi TaxID=3232308 RepID=UPI00366BD609
MNRRQLVTHRTVLLLLRTSVTTLALLGLAEAMFAGSFLNGHYAMLQAHRITGMVTGAVAILQAVVVIPAGAGGRGPRRPIAGTAVLAVAVPAQIGLGLGRALGLHVMLGVLVVSSIMLLAVQVWRTPLPARSPSSASSGSRSTVAAAS